ncbi:MAG: hypothetical protein Q8K21_13795 [Hydrogenophaga sp.]|nr:hypothetical protein [Hydrogenophaga sp.]MDP2165259.1 hypothetical protein [Hydrogenophaga sp.]MDP3477225.1 hypothetical protein [Hydrogenophaga sp.]
MIRLLEWGEQGCNRRFKAGAVVTHSTRRIRLCLAFNWASAQTFAHAVSQRCYPLNGKQRLAGAMTEKSPATQAGGGVGATAWRMRAISALAAVPIAASFAHTLRRCTPWRRLLAVCVK